MTTMPSFRGHSQASVPATSWPVWYAVSCRTLRERQVAIALRLFEQVQVYLPEIVRRTRGKSEQVPFFPGYLFILADLDIVARSAINATQGVQQIIAFDGVPFPIPRDVIETLQQRIDAINASGGLRTHSFAPGDQLRVKSGPLRGLDAVFQSARDPDRRVRVLIDFLGSLRELEIEAEDLEPVHNAVQQKMRGTRGKGRRIATTST